MRRTNESLAMVIPSKNRVEDIRRLLRSVAAQPTPPDEVIVVDQSRQAYDLGVLPSSKLVHHYDPSLGGLTAARNAGIALTTCEYVLMLDDDCELMTDVVAQLRRGFAAYPDAVALACLLQIPPQIERLITPSRALARIPIRLPFAISGLWNRTFAHGFFGNKVPPGQLPLAPGAASAYRSWLFERERFDEVLTGYGYGEDWEFSKRARRHGTIRLVSDACIMHHYSFANRDANRKMAQDRWRNWLYFYDKLQSTRTPADRFWRVWWMLGETLLWMRKRYGSPLDLWQMKKGAL